MHHPFFENTVYPWKRPEARALYDELVLAIPDPPEIRRRYEYAGGPLDVINWAQPTRELWHDALKALVRAGRLRDLCQALAGDRTFAKAGTLQAAVSAVIDAVSDAERPIVDRVLVLDRQGLRRKLAELADDQSPRNVLIVRGEQKSGKSRARFPFRALAAERGAAAVYLANGLVATVEEVVAELSAAVGDEEPDVESFTTDVASYRSICRKLLKCANRNDRRVWVAVDDLGPDADGSPLLDPEIRTFCETFAVMCLNPLFAERFRLLLIHYPAGSVPTTWKDELWTEDKTSEDDITAADVAAFLQSWSEGRPGTLRDDQRAAEVRNIFARCDAADSDDKPRLERLHDAVRESLDRLTDSIPANGGGEGG